MGYFGGQLFKIVCKERDEVTKKQGLKGKIRKEGGDMEVIGDYEIPDGWTQPLADGGEGADVVVFGTPAYFYSCTGQLKVLFDRTVAIYPDLPNKQYYYLLAQVYKLGLKVK